MNTTYSPNGKIKIERCAWASPNDPVYLAYHDDEWGVPVHDDRTLFEFLLLEGAQAGLSWATILRRRAGYRAAFAGFDPAKVARLDRRRIEALLQNPAIIRNRLKVESAVTNARAFLAIQEAHGSFDTFLWRYVDGHPVQNAWPSHADVPPRTALSDTLSKDLKKLGFKFVGSTICYSLMQAVGLVNDHVTSCFRHRELAGR
ncbi:MAG TPA: DNA-3-methyladenine glycosylase I [Gammaproteobacteria bacterium]|nr:DNA-3-methyladenine glycosylase I [Gammaproteobacteria bacterium]